MHKASKRVGYIDSIGSIDRLAHDFSPKWFSGTIKDPYTTSFGREIKKTMHWGPAESKTLTPVQIKHLVHELKEKGYSSPKAKQTAENIRKYSRAHMNDAWELNKTSKLWGNMDFDMDGVKNKDDCYPFDYDRQATMASLSAKTKASSKPLTVLNADGTVAKGLVISKSTSKSSSSETSNLGQTQGLYSPSRGKYGPYTDAILIDKNTGVYDPTTSTYTSPTGEKSSRPQTNIPAGTLIIPKYGSSSTVSKSASFEGTGGQTYTPVTTEAPIYGDVFDNAKFQENYNRLLQELAPEYQAALRTKIQPYEQEFTKRAGQVAGMFDFQSRAAQSRALRAQKMASILRPTFINQPTAMKQQKILQQRTESLAAQKTAELNKVQAEYDKAVNPLLQQEEMKLRQAAEARAREGATSTGIIGTQTTTTSVPTGTTSTPTNIATPTNALLSAVVFKSNKNVLNPNRDILRKSTV